MTTPASGIRASAPPRSASSADENLPASIASAGLKFQSAVSPARSFACLFALFPLHIGAAGGFARSGKGGPRHFGFAPPFREDARQFRFEFIQGRLGQSFVDLPLPL